jgi:hypothetical protein
MPRASTLPWTVTTPEPATTLARGEDCPVSIGLDRPRAAATAVLVLATRRPSTTLGEPRTEEAQVGGTDVTQIFDDAAEGQPPLLVYASSDTVWLISGNQDSAATVLESLP